jgi:hypothetical protein
MRFLLAGFILGLVCGCAHRATAPEPDSTAFSGSHEIVVRQPGSANASSITEIQQQLGLNRSVMELGLEEKSFDSCSLPVKDGMGKCGQRYMAVLNFQIVCRDSEGTVSEVVTNFKPLVNDHIVYQLGGGRGVLKTDGNGYSQLLMIGSLPLHGHQLILTVGDQDLGKELSEIKRLVVPKYWCH